MFWLIDHMHNDVTDDVFLDFVTISTSMLYGNRNRKRLQILAKHSGSCSHAEQQTSLLILTLDNIFSGMDPSTDLRGCGFLGLMNILYVVTEPRAQVLATNIYKLSLHETQNFPFSVMSINITRIALQTLREGKLNR
jgi:hypothetical protein